QLKPDEALLTPQAALRIFGTEHAVGKELVTSSGKPVRVAGILKEPSTKSSFQFDVVLSVYLMKDWSRVAYEVVRLHRPEDGNEINQANRTPMQLICYGQQAVYYQLVPLKDFYLSRQVSAYADSVTQGRPDVLRLLGLVVGLILLVGLLNYMNLYSVVMLKRGRELGMKKVLGAGKGQIFLQLYVENVCLNAAVVFLAWLLVEVTRRLVDAWFDIPVQGDLRFDLLLSAAVLFLLPLFTMLPPYWRYAHAAPMRSLSQVGMGGKATRSRTVFLFLQYVIAFCLTVAAIYLSRHLQFLLHTAAYGRGLPHGGHHSVPVLERESGSHKRLGNQTAGDEEEEECCLCPAGKTHRGVTLVYGNDLWHPALQSATGYPLPYGRRTGSGGLLSLGLA
ncbi:FtsX-like permease family protein, partial [uncultured Bacteroides sp.]|uniref:ABC transporter permease n=1 Tax=uncultured Bacteroides sp. TaxID=162156 RepID=UPI0034518B69